MMSRYHLFFILIFIDFSSFAQTVAFPGAGGFGKFARGGRGGEVYHVTNLDDFGSGSFREAVSQPHRIIVFDIAGVIRIKSKLSVASYITIAGQTAPGEGITIYGNGVSFSGSNDVIVCGIRFRGSVDMGRGTCTVSADHAHDIIFDHVSIEWGRWDNLHIKESKDITLQYCLIGEGINPQMFGALLEHPVNLTIHHCLWVDNQSRNPKAKAGIEFINNVIYNWGSNGFVGGHSGANHYQDIINNYFIAGPNSSESFICMFTATDHVYQKGNLVDQDKDGKLNGCLITNDDFSKIGATIETKANNSSLSESEIDTPVMACKKVLACSGASRHRDAVDKRLVSYVKSLGKKGMIIRSEEEAGGQKRDQHKAKRSARDTDGDGMPDRWEKRHHLNPKNPDDGNTITHDGYTNLEIYVNKLVQ